MVSLLFGIGALLWADFGMPGWFFILSQAWLWTLGLPTLMGVLAVAAVWGIPGWTTGPLWAFLICASLGALAVQTAVFHLLHAGWRRLTGAKQ